MWTDTNANSAPLNFNLICQSLFVSFSEPQPNFHGFIHTPTHFEYLEVCWIVISEPECELSLSSVKSRPLLQLSQMSFPLFGCTFFFSSSLLSSPPHPHPSIRLYSFLSSSLPSSHSSSPPSSPPVKISHFHPPRLCIPPEGRLSSSPISSRSLLALSHSTPSFLFSLSLVCHLTQKRHTRSDTHSPVICQHCQLRWKETSLPRSLPAAHFFISNPTTVE